MYVYRLCRIPFPAIDGVGAQLNGGRWNSVGKRVVYTSATLSLAALEYLVHIPAKLTPTDLISLKIEIPDDLAIEAVDAATLPVGWNDYGDSHECRSIGDDWIAQARTPILRVPAAPIDQEYNYLMNPLHPAATRIVVTAHTPFTFDERLLVK